MGKLRIPKEATAVRVEKTPSGYELVFSIPGGNIRILVGADMPRASQLSADITRKIKARKKA